MKTNKTLLILQKTIKKNVQEEQQKKSIATINVHLKHAKSRMAQKDRYISI